MRRISTFFVLLFVFLGLNAQTRPTTVQGVPYDFGNYPKKVEQKSTKKKSTKKVNDTFTFEDIKFWVGEGENEAALVIDQYFDGETATVWGYRWDGDAYGIDMISAICKADPRLLFLTQETNLGYTIAGIGFGPARSVFDLKYDLEGAKNDPSISFGFDTPNVFLGQDSCPSDPAGLIARSIEDGKQTGVIYHPLNYSNYGYACYDYDHWSCGNPAAKWRSAWYTGYWSYLIRDDEKNDFSYSGLGATKREIVDGSWDAWGFQDGWDSWDGVNPREPFVAALPFITLTTNEVSVEKGKTVNLVSSLHPENATTRSIKWTSSNANVATVDQQGRVTAKSPGTATITAMVEGEDILPATCALTVEESFNMTMDDIKYWIGTGSNSTAVVVKWNDGKEGDAFVWGYRWDGEKKVVDMLKDIVAADDRLFVVLNEIDSINNLAGFGYDLNGKNTAAVVYNNDRVYPSYPVMGLISIKTTDFDNYTIFDAEDHWSSGSTKKGTWQYLVMEDGEASFDLSKESILQRNITDQSWNAWNFDTNFEGIELGHVFAAVPEYVRKSVDYTKGIFFVNEDWFGHTNGSVNFLTSEGEWIYRAYSRENPGQAFGCTTQFGTIYGDNFYFISKQALDKGDKQYIPGGRLVVADAKTMKKKAGFDNIGGGDGRSFLGVNDSIGYIGTSSGIVLFDIPNLAVGKFVEGTGGGSLYDGQIGTMLRIGDYVFACRQSSGILVIDAEKHEVVGLIDCKNIGTIVQSKDGSLWATAYSDGLWKINPYTLEVVEKRDIPSAALIPGSWGAWTPSLICASDKTNTLYWAKMNGSGMTFFGTKVFKYDIDNPDLSSPFYELTGKEAFYGSGINIDPVTDNLLITSTQTGYGGNYQYNWVHIVNSETGNAVEVKQLDNYYWFPSMSTFPDNHAPVISDDLNSLDIKEKTTVSLLDRVTDDDNRDAAIVKKVQVIEGDAALRVTISQDSLVLQPLSGSPAKIRLTVNSNGKMATKDIPVAIEFTGVDDIELNNNALEVEAKDVLELAAIISPLNASNKTVFWTSSDKSLATVDENGVVTTYGISKKDNGTRKVEDVLGTVTITATTEDGGKVAACELTIMNVPVEGMSLDRESATLDARIPETLQLNPVFTPSNATNQIVAWESSNPDAATVDDNGLVTPIADGKATIKATSEDGNFVATSEISVYTSVRRVNLNSTYVNIDVHGTYQLIATVLPDNATNPAIKSWTSRNPDIATVDENGLVTAVSAGYTTVTVTTVDGEKTATCTIVCNNVPATGVSIAPESKTIYIGDTEQFVATVLPENATNKKIKSWVSANPNVATVDESGLVKGLAEGTTTVTATSEDGNFEGSSEVIVTILTGIDGEGKVALTRVYPTVTKGEITIEQENIEPIIVTTTGGVVLQSIRPESAKVNVDLGTYPADIYLVKIGNTTVKIVKQ